MPLWPATRILVSVRVALVNVLAPGVFLQWRCNAELKKSSTRRTTSRAVSPVSPAWVVSGLRHQFSQQVGFSRMNSARVFRSEEHTSELQSLMRISYAVFCLQKKKL